MMDLLTCIKCERAAHDLISEITAHRTLGLYGGTPLAKVGQDSALERAQGSLAALAKLMGFTLAPIEAEAAKDAA